MGEVPVERVARASAGALMIRLVSGISLTRRSAGFVPLRVPANGMLMSRSIAPFWKRTLSRTGAEQRARAAAARQPLPKKAIALCRLNRPLLITLLTA